MEYKLKVVRGLNVFFDVHVEGLSVAHLALASKDLPLEEVHEDNATGGEGSEGDLGQGGKQTWQLG